MSTTSTRRAGLVVALLGAAALTAPAIAGAAPSTGSLGSSAPAAGFTCAATSTEKTPAGWGNEFSDENGPKNKVSYTADKVKDTDGSLKLEVANETSRSAWYHSASQVKLSEVVTKDIAFSEPSGVAKATFQIRITKADATADNGFATLVWGPESTSTGDHNDLKTSDQWWSTRTIGSITKGSRTTLAAIAAANPNAVVDHYGISLGSGSPATSASVDAVKFNGCTTNFALKDAPAGPLGSLGNIFGS